ncbi:MAG: hypothetical protein ACO1TE_24385 [Prosthecobacter sp.]
MERLQIMLESCQQLADHMDEAQPQLPRRCCLQGACLPAFPFCSRVFGPDLQGLLKTDTSNPPFSHLNQRPAETTNACAPTHEGERVPSMKPAFKPVQLDEPPLVPGSLITQEEADAYVAGTLLPERLQTIEALLAKSPGFAQQLRQLRDEFQAFFTPEKMQALQDEARSKMNAVLGKDAAQDQPDDAGRPDGGLPPAEDEHS